MNTHPATASRGADLLLPVAVALVCACGPSTQVRAHLDAGRIPEAARAAGTSPPALEAVALETLRRGLENGTTRRSAARGLAGAGSFARATLEEALGSSDGDASCVAAALLAELGESTGARLEACLRAESAESRAEAVRALAAQGDGDPRALLVAALADASPEVRRAAAAAVGELGNGALAVELLGALAENDGDEGARAAAIRALGRAGPRLEALAVARRALEASSSSIRLAAVSAVANVDDDEATSLLRGLLDDQGAVAARAAAVLAARRDGPGLEALQRLLRAEDEGVASAAAVGAGAVAEELREPLLAALDRAEPEVRLRAAAALRRVEPDVAQRALAQLLAEPGLVGVGAALLLADERRVAADHLEAALGSEDDALRAYVASMSPTVADGLLLARLGLADSEPTVRVAAAGAILRILARTR